MTADRFGAIRSATARLARDVSTVAEVAKRPAEKSIETRQMIARLEEWSALLWSIAEHASLGLNETIEQRRNEAELATLPSPMESFDAAVWAKSFVDHVRLKPSIATDEGTMQAWFASALMRGYDERAWERQRRQREDSQGETPLMDTHPGFNAPTQGQGGAVERRRDVPDPSATNDAAPQVPTSQSMLADLIILLDRARAQANRLRQSAPDLGSSFGVIRETQRASVEAYLASGSGRSPLMMLQASLDRVRFGLSEETAYLALVELAAVCQVVAERTYAAGARVAAETVKREAASRVAQTQRMMESRREIRPAYGALGMERRTHQMNEASGAPEFARYDRDRDNPVQAQGPDGVR